MTVRPTHATSKLITFLLSLSVLLTLLPLFVPGMSMGAALFIFFRSFLGFKLGFWSILIGHVVWALPFSLLIVLVLTTRYDDWNEPNDSSKPGPDTPNRVLRQKFCTVGVYGGGLYTLLARCKP